jgi:pimeloyl-ACP methyl ester carboxylesterase
MTRSRWTALLSLPLALSLVAPSTVLAEATSFDSAGVPINFTDMGGDGEPVVLIHSFTSTSDMWTKAGFEPSDDFRFIALDVRGHGQSGKPDDPAAYGGEMVDDVVRLMDHLELEDAHVAGYSMGAEIALKLATEHPDRVRSLVAGGSGWSPAEAYEVYQFASMGLEDAATFGESVTAMMPPEVTDEQMAFLFDAMEQHGVETDNEDTAALANVARSMNEIIDLPEEAVAAIDVPVLGISSENDSELPNITRMDGVVPDFSLVLIPAGPTGDPSLDHLGATLDPLFHVSVMEFLSEQP